MNAEPRFGELSALFLFFNLLFSFFIANGYVFDSIAHLESLVDLEHDLGQKLKAYVNSRQEGFEQVKGFVKLVENETSLAKAQGPDYVNNPINAFSIIKRFTDHWTKMDLLLQEDEKRNDMIKTLNSSKERRELNETDDLIGAIAALFRLQSTYNISARTMLEGKIPGCQPASPMTVDDCFDLGSVAYRSYHLTRSREWLKEGVRLIREMHPKEPAKLKSLLEYLAWVEYLTGNVEEALELTEELITLAPGEQKLIDNLNYYRELVDYDYPLNQDQLVARDEEINTKAYINSTYSRVCRGENIKPIKHQNKLKCWWFHGRHNSALLIKPAKLELINLKPKIYIFRDMVTDSEAATIKKLASPILKRATVLNLDTKILETAEYRVSKSAWLEDTAHEVVARVNRRASLVTGLDQYNAEYLQVANYGMGGQYEKHVDYGDPDTPLAADPKGNRVATLLIYLNDVAVGGATAFLEAGISISPTKGDAVFWYNLKRSGEGDETTVHAGCPVLCGNKWVANKWFREGGRNIFHRPCALNINLQC